MRSKPSDDAARRAPAARFQRESADDVAAHDHQEGSREPDRRGDGETKVVTKNVVQMFLDEIVRELASGNRLRVRDFGVFEVKSRRARRAQNPRTLEKVAVPPKKVVKFKVGPRDARVRHGWQALPAAPAEEE